MLFDLRGRGRRRMIQVIYASLAAVLLGGVLFAGIGGGGGFGGGGLASIFGQSSGRTQASDVFAANVKAAEKKLKLTPRDPAAWAALVHARFQVAGSSGNFDQTTRAFTASGKTELALVKQAWDGYLALKPNPPSSDTAGEMVRALGPDGLNRLADAVAAEEIVTAQNPTSPSEYVRLGVLAFFAGQTRKGDLAFAQALNLEPKDKQAALKLQLADAKTKALAQAAQQQLGGTNTAPHLPGG